MARSHIFWMKEQWVPKYLIWTLKEYEEDLEWGGLRMARMTCGGYMHGKGKIGKELLWQPTIGCSAEND